MELIKKLDDERLKLVPQSCHEHILDASLRAVLQRGNEQEENAVMLLEEVFALRTERDAALAQLCRARESLDGPGAERHHGEPSLFNGGFNAGVYSCRNRLKAALSSTAPCPHEAEAKRLREAIDHMRNSLNWIESDNGYEMKRPGGGGRSWIMLISETLNPWDYINKVMGLRREGEGKN